MTPVLCIVFLSGLASGVLLMDVLTSHARK
jgi:hypothetical protein